MTEAEEEGGRVAIGGCRDIERANGIWTYMRRRPLRICREMNSVADRAAQAAAGDGLGSRL